MENLQKSNTDYHLITAFREINEVLKLEKSLFLNFEYEREFLDFPFRENFDIYSFSENHTFFRREIKYRALTTFLKSIDSSFFLVSSPSYCGLYPLKISVSCPFITYSDIISYMMQETFINSQNQEVRRPLGHPMRGAGFVIMPHVFIYDETRQWAMLLEDNITPVAIIGIKEGVREQFNNSLGETDFTSISEIVKRPNMEIYSVDFEDKLFNTYGNVTP